MLLTYARRRGDYSNSECSTLRKQRGDDGDTRDEYQATSDTNTNSLCQNDLPVSSAEAQGHRTQDNEKTADIDKGVEISPVIHRPNEDTHNLKKKALDRTYPRDGRRGLVVEQAELIVFLVYTKAADDSPVRW